MRMRICLALAAAPRRARLVEKIEVHLLAPHQPFELGDARFGEREGGALVVVRR
ncbi:hypothetical protein NLM33_40685 [Bradyrhizobium sp. CCGUVB1N3]|uniref:hypothetical protein n=1 Tax=Bradyrhizobium sp. CCGUVB1N3 TaxID=2949629 RepID=UPI0020B3F482|nr:hypothetical protein [Bradyrhizobium sp. CCGUVB1N3]MCP3476530.1 hypothetical protein [Bradyrhizobium sp. CCGUVB1N3]